MAANITQAEWQALQPHEKLNYSSQMPNAVQLGNNNMNLPSPVKRPLNSWMAFRTYYTRMFASLPQKKASPILTAMWRVEPFKNKWTVLAKAYSILRDHLGKDRVQLERFLDTVSTEFGIISYEIYTMEMNWEIGQASDGTVCPRQLFARSIDTFPRAICDISMTDLDLIRLCGKKGFVPVWAAENIVEIHGHVAAHPLLATPVLAAPVNPIPEVNLVSMAEADPEGTASSILGFDVTKLLDEISVWNTDDAAFYEQTAGYIDVYQLSKDGAGSCWDAVDMENPVEVDRLLSQGLVQDGHLIPIIPAIERETNH